MKIYTKTGDLGQTSLGDGKRISKSDPRICAYGEIDELSCVLGICKTLNTNVFLAKILQELQEDLFALASDLAAPNMAKPAGKIVPRINIKAVERLEKWIDQISEKLPELRNFILPGGSRLAAELHLARAVCRRAERAIIKLLELARREPADSTITYVNRLSDLLFMMARHANFLEGIEDEKWHA